MISAQVEQQGQENASGAETVSLKLILSIAVGILIMIGVGLGVWFGVIKLAKGDAKCTLTPKDGYSTQYAVLKKDGERQAIYCPPHFSLISVIWAAKEASPDLDVHNSTAAFYEDGLFRVERCDLDHCPTINVSELRKPIVNPPGVGDIPPVPWQGEEDQDRLFEEEYRKWKEFAAKDTNSCVVVTNPQSDKEYDVKLVGFGKDPKDLHVRCDGKVTFTAVFNAVHKHVKQPLAMYRFYEGRWSYDLVGDREKTIYKRMAVWKMIKANKQF